MSIVFWCSGCGTKYRVEEHFAGHRLTCQCGTSVEVPHATVFNASSGDTAGGSYLRREESAPTEAEPTDDELEGHDETPELEVLAAHATEEPVAGRAKQVAVAMPAVLATSSRSRSRRRESRVGLYIMLMGLPAMGLLLLALALSGGADRGGGDPASSRGLDDLGRQTGEGRERDSYGGGGTTAQGGGPGNSNTRVYSSSATDPTFFPERPGAKPREVVTRDYSDGERGGVTRWSRGEPDDGAGTAEPTYTGKKLELAPLPDDVSALSEWGQKLPADSVEGELSFAIEGYVFQLPGNAKRKTAARIGDRRWTWESESGASVEFELAMEARTDRESVAPRAGLEVPHGYTGPRLIDATGAEVSYGRVGELVFCRVSRRERSSLGARQVRIHSAFIGERQVTFRAEAETAEDAADVLGVQDKVVGTLTAVAPWDAAGDAGQLPQARPIGLPRWTMTPSAGKWVELEPVKLKSIGSIRPPFGLARHESYESGGERLTVLSSERGLGDSWVIRVTRMPRWGEHAERRWPELVQGEVVGEDGEPKRHGFVAPPGSRLLRGTINGVPFARVEYSFQLGDGTKHCTQYATYRGPYFYVVQGVCNEGNETALSVVQSSIATLGLTDATSGAP